MAMRTYFIVLVWFVFMQSVFVFPVEVAIMITKDEGRDESISTALRIEEVMHSNKKYKHGAPRAPFGFCPMAKRSPE